MFETRSEWILDGKHRIPRRNKEYTYCTEESLTVVLSFVKVMPVLSSSRRGGDLSAMLQPSGDPSTRGN
jgi:hypothetical protein